MCCQTHGVHSDEMCVCVAVYVCNSQLLVDAPNSLQISVKREPNWPTARPPPKRIFSPRVGVPWPLEPKQKFHNLLVKSDDRCVGHESQGRTQNLVWSSPSPTWAMSTLKTKRANWNQKTKSCASAFCGLAVAAFSGRFEGGVPEAPSGSAPETNQRFARD